MPLHDGSHFSVTKNPGVWQFCMHLHDFLNGASSLIWVRARSHACALTCIAQMYQHVLGHHPYTNIEGADPDIETVEHDVRRIKTSQVSCVAFVLCVTDVRCTSRGTRTTWRSISTHPCSTRCWPGRHARRTSECCTSTRPTARFASTRRRRGSWCVGVRVRVCARDITASVRGVRAVLVLGRQSSVVHLSRVDTVVLHADLARVAVPHNRRCACVGGVPRVH
jgi:hypothetical protein